VSHQDPVSEQLRSDARGHTLVLGWNESTPRLICQMAFLRRAWKIQNETWRRRACPWLRVPPSTPVAASRIVVMCDQWTKPEIDEKIEVRTAPHYITHTT
jgi:hypothetical protein